MKTPRRFWWLAGIGALVAALGAFLALPAWAAPTGQSTTPPTDTPATMHAACAGGDVESMQGAMDSLTDEGWQAMGEHRVDGHHDGMDGPMMGSGGMTRGHMGRHMMNGMAGTGHGQGMMAW